MSQSQLRGVEAVPGRDDEQRSVTDDDEIGSVLEALEDADCRTILAGTSDAALSVTEITERFGIPKSTAYRKVEDLADNGLLEKRVRLDSAGHHVSAYACSVEDVTLSIDDETGVELSVSGAAAGAEEPSAGRLF
ncbi:winged helix-turn-helix domain-containing protein [Halomicrobium salinisoli]|uniref:winged helix-turn-helix domain-containing protein n=1 Tax=Halomicrobium salinisoli TaxID=2878391 RepID=UPI001CF09AE6|nr:helix-turn-helix domain-containing protein [Halomicrobium salinisoli]